MESPVNKNLRSVTRIFCFTIASVTKF